MCELLIAQAFVSTVMTMYEDVRVLEDRVLREIFEPKRK
jgi:hypothetical protein